MEPDERAARADAYESVRSEIVDLVPAEVRRVLDLGCSTGWLARALKARGEVEVVGSSASRPTRRRRAPTATTSWWPTSRPCPTSLGASTASSPPTCSSTSWTRGGARRLRGDARARLPAVISLPNAAHWTTFAALARGTWPRPPEGIHDATHLRWFTLRDAIALSEGAGLAVAHVERRPWLLWRGTRLDRHAGPLARLSPFTFQHVLAA